MIDIANLIKTTLKIPVIELFEPILPPCATWYPIVDTTGLAGDGKETEGIEGYQIDVWDRDKKEILVYGRMLKEALKANDENVSIPELSYIYDTNGKMWHAMLTFYAIRKE